MSGDKTVAADPLQREQARAEDKAALKLSLMGLAGASIEWYDFFIYGTAAALVFPTVFFPADMPPLVALIASFSTFAVGFIARPFGAVFFGHMGDRVGRKKTLVTALILMGVASTLIACLPSYHSAGVFAPLALVLLRVAQGFAVGGQWGGAILIAIESAPKARRGLYGSIVQASVPAGVLLANLAFIVVSGATTPEAFMAYGWRIPFLLSIVLVGLGLFLNARIEETLAFRQLQIPVRPAPGRSSPVLEALRRYPGKILLAAGAFVSTNAIFYINTFYVVAYGTSATGLQLPRSTMLGAILIGTVSAPLSLLAGAFSDRYGRRRIFMTGAALMGVWAFIFFPLLETRSFLWITVAISANGAFSALTYGPLAAMYAELFDTRVRYSAVSLAYGLGAIVGGGLAPIIATGLYARFHSTTWIAVYMAATCVLSLACVSRLRETARVDL